MMPAISADTEETRYGNLMDIQLLIRFAGFARRSRKWVFLALVLLPLGVLIQTAQPMVLKWAVDDHLTMGRLDGFEWLLLALTLLVGLQFFLGYVQQTVNTLIGQQVVLDLRQSMFRHMLRQDAAFYHRHTSGRLTNRLTSDTEAVNQMVSAGMINLVGDVLLLVGIAISMAVLSPRLALIAVTALPVIILITTLSGRRMRSLQREGRLLQSRLAGRFTEEIEGQEVVRLFHRQQHNREAFDQLNQEYLATAIQSNYWEALQFSIVEAASTVIIAGFFGYGAYLAGDSTVTIGTLVAFIDYIRRVFMPIRDLSVKFSTMQAAMTALERIFSLLDTQPAIPTPMADALDPGPIVSRIQPIAPEIILEEVRFDYGQGPVLNGVSFRVAPGEKVALVGPTGAGKSSIIKLLNRTHDVTGGQVRIDGCPVREIPLGELRRMVGMVQQDTILFAGSVAENIGMGDPAISAEKIRWAAQQTGAASFIETMAEGYGSLLTEGGRNLSMGQRQLLGIARVLAFDPAILVMDEATSSVDTISERLIQKAMAALLTGRTSVVIAHRLSTILDADRILVLSQGRIVESGTHADLLTQNGLYAKLFFLQFQEMG